MMVGGCGRQYRMGTSLGFIFNDEGVMVSLDHSNILSPENSRVLNSHLLAVVCGVDKFQCQGLIHFLQLKRFQLEEGRRASAAEASKWLADHLTCNPCSDYALSVEVLIAGWDNESGPALYHVHAQGRMCSRPAIGSGIAAHGCAYLSPRDSSDFRSPRFLSKRGSGKSVRYNMSVTEAIELARDALCRAALLVPESRKFCSVFHVGSDGVKHVLVDYDIGEWQKKYLREEADERVKSYIYY
ncbi:OLC1v1015471C1 [Oldenlandia corymbosa var. corymbosa]|uniref:OLC1v1015471C1 n=1 Tax=Oldenlandia corymbosa var. corymbosa TaxID=529605 RepID=A0AAV1E5K4_OLDCO|nr:OLC1v1015471C1 [Oldenlandia corymbosa var. corymbosa]